MTGLKLSPLDVRIIRLLTSDSRLPIIRLAELLEEPESTVRGRLARLVDGKMIDFVAQTDPFQMGFDTWVMVGLKVALPHLSAITTKLGEFEEVYFIAVTTGGFDVMFNAVFADNAGLHDFLVEKLSRIEGINDTTTFHYLAVPKRKIAVLPITEGERKRKA